MPGDPFKNPEAPAELPRGPHGLDREVVMASQRGRLLSAFVEVAGEKGYHATTIQDIVGRAGTAKRTFYEYFRDKDECFAQAFAEGSASLVAAIVDAAEPVEDPIERIAVGVRTYLDYLSTHSAFSRFFLTEGITAGPELAEAWLRWIERLGDVLVLWRRESRQAHPEVPEMTKMQAVAVLSAINEVARITIHRVGVDGLPGITDELVDLAMALFTAELHPPAGGGA